MEWIYAIFDKIYGLDDQTNWRGAKRVQGSLARVHGERFDKFLLNLCKGDRAWWKVRVQEMSKGVQGRAICNKAYQECPCRFYRGGLWAWKYQGMAVSKFLKVDEKRNKRKLLLWLKQAV